MKDVRFAASESETWHFTRSIYEKAICHPSTKNPGDASWKPRHASAVDDQDMTRADELRRLRSDVRGEPRRWNRSDAGRVGLVSCPFFWGGVFKDPLYWNWCAGSSKTMSCIAGCREGLENPWQNDRSLWRVWGSRALLPTLEERASQAIFRGHSVLVNEISSIYFPGVLETWRLINLKIEYLFNFFGAKVSPSCRDLLKIHDQEKSNQNLNLTNSRGMLPDPPKKTCFFFSDPTITTSEIGFPIQGGHC